jgi:hypothetical protein
LNEFVTPMMPQANIFPAFPSTEEFDPPRPKSSSFSFIAIDLPSTLIRDADVRVLAMQLGKGVLDREVPISSFVCFNVAQ